MHAIEQQLERRNLETAWALAGDWSPEHQDRLAELVVERIIRRHDSSNSTYTRPGCGVRS